MPVWIGSSHDLYLIEVHNAGPSPLFEILGKRDLTIVLYKSGVTEECKFEVSNFTLSRVDIK